MFCPCGDPRLTPLPLEIRHSWVPIKPPRGQTLRSPRPRVTSVLISKERFYTPPPPGSCFRDCDCTIIETKASIHHLLWVMVLVVVVAVVVYRFGLPITRSIFTGSMVKLLFLHVTYFVILAQGPCQYSLHRSNSNG